MNKKTGMIIGGVVLVLVVILGLTFWQKSQTKPQNPSQDKALAVHQAKKVDLKSQPEWVQKLSVKAVKGTRKGERGLDNVTITIENIPKDTLTSLTYTISYSYQAKDGESSSGFFTDTPVAVDGAETFSKKFDFGTCSTKSCVRHDGVTALEIEFDLNAKNGDAPIWTGTVEVE